MNVAASIPPMTPVAIECRLAAPAPPLMASGVTPRMNASEVITIGRKRNRAPSTAASASPMPSCDFQLRELDDQDRVLRCEADQGHEPDLEIQVVLLSPQEHGQECAEQCEWHRENHRERQGPAFVLGCEHQEHHEHADQDNDRRAAAEAFSWYDVPVHSSAYPSGNACFATCSIACNASPELYPGAASPSTLADGNTL